MDTASYNFWAILVAAVASVGIGMIWYAPPVLGKKWQGYVGISQPAVGAMALWGVCYLLLAFTLAYVFARLNVADAAGGLRWGLTFAAVVGFAIAPNYAFARKPLGLFLIEGGYMLLALGVTSLILGAWR